MAQAKKLRSGTFNATITPVAIEKGNTKNGVRYSKMVGATMSRKGHPDKVRTVMAFGRSNAAVFRSLKPGKPVELACQFEGGTIRVVGKATTASTATKAA